MEEGLQDGTPSRRQPWQNWGRQGGLGYEPWTCRSSSLLSPEGQGVRVMRSTETHLLGYRVGQRDGMVWWALGTHGEYPTHPSPPTLPQADPSAGGQDHPRKHIPGPSGCPRGGLHRVCAWLSVALYIIFSLSHLPAQPSWAPAS